MWIFELKPIIQTWVIADANSAEIQSTSFTFSQYNNYFHYFQRRSCVLELGHVKNFTTRKHIYNQMLMKDLFIKLVNNCSFYLKNQFLSKEIHWVTRTPKWKNLTNRIKLQIMKFLCINYRILLRLVHGSLFWVEFILTDFVGILTFLVSFSNSFSSFSLTFSPVLGFNSFNISFWDFIRSVLISEVIFSLKEARRLSKTLFSILGDLALEGRATDTSWSRKSEFPTTTREIKPSFTFSVFSWENVLRFLSLRYSADFRRSRLV